MFLNIEIDSNTKAYQLRALAQLMHALELGAQGEEPQFESRKIGPVIQSEPIPQTAPAPEVETQSAPETTRRKRRTKAEIEADEAAAKVEKPAEENGKVADAEAAAGETTSSEDEVVNTEPGEITGNTEPPADDFESVEKTTPAAGGKEYTQAEVQALASALARTKGPQLVKDKIAALGADRIGALSQEGINELGAYLEAQK